MICSNNRSGPKVRKDINSTIQNDNCDLVVLEDSPWEEVLRERMEENVPVYKKLYFIPRQGIKARVD